MNTVYPVAHKPASVYNIWLYSTRRAYWDKSINRAYREHLESAPDFPGWRFNEATV